jgi:hypothetical protein
VLLLLIGLNVIKCIFCRFFLWHITAILRHGLNRLQPRGILSWEAPEISWNQNLQWKVTLFFMQNKRIRMLNYISSKLPSDRLWLFRRSVNCWRVSALARTLQLFTYRLNNRSRSRKLRTFLYDVADL